METSSPLFSGRTCFCLLVSAPTAAWQEPRVKCCKAEKGIELVEFAWRCVIVCVCDRERERERGGGERIV